ncbi:MAG: AbrB/MazE/SpoVT family DNA-binding domain-containing protein [Candidatus Hydrothermarchaeales archaeon]
MVTVTVTRNTQITIPKKIREKLEIKIGDKVDIRIEDGKIVVKKIETAFSEYSGFLPKGYEEVLDRVRKDSRERFKRLGVIP